MIYFYARRIKSKVNFSPRYVLSLLHLKPHKYQRCNDSRDADQFHGMVIHSVCAVLFCLLPTLVNLLVQDVVTTLHICCALLGVQIVAHCLAVMGFRTTSRGALALLMLGLLLGLVQFTAFTDWGVQREFDIYQVGVMWHILQAGLLFVLLIWIPPQDIEQAGM